MTNSTSLSGTVGRAFAGKNVIVTGGTTGIGFAIARQLAELGARVAVTGRSAESGARAAAQLQSISTESFFVQSDASNPESATLGVTQAAGRMGGLDILVSAGAQGATRPMPFTDMTLDQLQSGFNSRFFGRMFPVHAAVPLLRSRGGGSIVLITTDAARHPTPGETVIGATGAAIMLMTKALARELSPYAIRVNALALTLTSDTPSYERIFSKPSFENRLFSKALERFPSGRAPTADEVANAAVFLAGEQASQITGQILSVNGGLSFGGW